MNLYHLTKFTLVIVTSAPELVASRFGLFLASRFLFKQILNLNLTFAVCRKRHF